ncbi:MAG: N-glycosylase/DNA lyase [Chloroflexi bacterium]|nr:N-glycosylase/DNA lyase [Chloroflexota bacterium]
MEFSQLKRKYETKKAEIKVRMEEFRNFSQKANRDDLFAEVAYCICTPQTSFDKCQMAIDELKGKGLLFSGTEELISFFLKKNRVRFHNRKAKFIAEARAKLYEIGCAYDIRELITELLSMSQQKGREYLWKINISGLGMKESSHFLRNIGHGDDLAILDRHILRKLHEFGVIGEELMTVTPKEYVTIEGKMKQWAKQVGIPLGELDLLLWSEETGEIFK